MAERIAAYDWSSTPLGAVERWPPELKALVDQMLAAPLLASLAVGAERIFLYNDRAALLYGERHPGVLGQPLPEAFPHEFHHVAPFYARVFAGESVHVPAQPLDPGQVGTPEIFDAYLTPVRDSQGVVIAALMSGFAVGDRLRAEATLRENEARQGLLLRLGDALRTLTSPFEIRRKAMQLLGEELSLARIYYFDVEQDADAGRAHVIERGYQRDPAQVQFAGSYSLRNFGSWMFAGFDRGEPIVVSDIENLPGLTEEQRASFRALGVAAFINVPLLRDGAYAAGIGAHDIAPRKWREAEIALVREVAGRAWTASELARAEVAQRESDARLAAALDSVPVGVAVMDTSGAAVVSNSEFRRFLPAGIIPSMDPKAATHWRAWDEGGIPLHPDDFPGARALRGERCVPGQEMLFTDGSGREIWTSVTTMPVRDSAGTITGLVSVINDINERKRASKRLRKSEEQLRQFGEASQDILWIRDAETLQWVYLTPAFEEIYGLSREEALAGDNYRSWQDLIVPEDRDFAVSAIARVRAGEHVTFEYRVRRPSDGTVRWLRNTDFPITDESGQVALIGGIGHDFTEVREAELRLHTLVEGMPQLVWRAVDEGEWTWASSQWIEYAGQDESEYRDWGWLDAVHPDDHGNAREAWSHAMEHGGFEVEHRIRKSADEEYRWFQTRASPVRDRAGGIIEWLGTSTDIHDLRELQERQKILVAELQHRTRNLMGVVRSMGNITVQSSANLEDFRARFDDRLKALARAQGLLSRLSEHDRVTFDELIRSQLSAIDGRAERVTFSGPSGIRLRSSTVQTLAMALHELATNAVKYGALGQPAGRLSIRWSFEPSGPQNKPWLHIDWRESGVAMPPAGPAAAGTGQGRELIERALPYQLRARTSFVLGATGVHCMISIPVSGTTSERT